MEGSVIYILTPEGPIPTKLGIWSLQSQVETFDRPIPITIGNRSVKEVCFTSKNQDPDRG